MCSNYLVKKQSVRQQIKIPILHNGFHTMVSQNDNALLFKIKMRIGVFESSSAITYNDLHASDGRDTEALNCKPITNL